MEEHWLPVPNYPCDASSLGRIRRHNWQRQPTYGTTNKKGYRVVQVSGVQVRVSRLVCLAFHGVPPSPFHQAAHLDGKSDNNKSDNLAWKTAQENTEDKRLHGTILAGDSHPRAKLTSSDVIEIRKRKAAGQSILSIARDYPHVSPSTVSHAALGRNWK